jgi:hypothetical protein
MLDLVLEEFLPVLYRQEFLCHQLNCYCRST